jgi:integrase
MARVKLTAGRVVTFRCPSAKQQAFLWDTEVPGLGVRATAGAKAFIFQARLNGETLRITIGDVRAWDIESDDPKRVGAREQARRLQTLIDRGIDPRQEKAQNLKANEAAKQASIQGEARLRDGWRDYIKTRSPRWSPRHLADHQRVVQVKGEKAKKGKRNKTPGPLAPLLDLRLLDITSDRVRPWLASEATKRPTQARVAFGCLRGFLNWAAKRAEYRGIVHPDACDPTIAKESLPRKKAKRDHLEREQLKAWFGAVRRLDNQVIAAYLQSLLLLGCRREELANLKWTNVDFTWNALTLRDKTNAERERRIPLTPYVSSLLSRLPRRNEWVFSSPAAKSGRLQEPRPSHLRALRGAEIAGLTLHGLRRSFKTLSEWVEAPAGVVAQIQGHAPSATAEKHYTVRSIDLLRMWHVKIEKWILSEARIRFDFEANSSKVVELRRQRRPA